MVRELKEKKGNDGGAKNRQGRRLVLISKLGAYL